jgi:N-methylhydantoinase A
VPAPVLDLAQVRAEFEARHQRQYGHYQPDGEIEIVHLRLAGIGRLKRVPPPPRRLTKAQPIPHTRRSLFLDAQAGFQLVPVYDGNTLQPGQQIDGPALIEERNTTILIGRHDRLEIDAHDNFLIRVAQQEASP